MLENGSVAEVLSYDPQTLTFDLRNFPHRSSHGSVSSHYRLQRNEFRIEVPSYLNYQVGAKYTPTGTNGEFTIRAIYEDGTVIFEKKSYSGGRSSMQVKTQTLTKNLRQMECEKL